MTITAVIITLNEERNIHRCIHSLKGIVDEVLIVDTGSTDHTIKIAREEGAHIVSATWQGFSGTKNQANSLAKGDYILSLDADECLSEEMQAYLLRIKKYLVGGYEFNRRNFFAGKWIRGCGWYPDTKIRLFPKGQAEWKGDFVHETLAIGTKITLGEGDILHYTYENEQELIAKLDKYTTLAAQELYEKKAKASLLKRYLSPAWKFISLYFFKKGLLDGYYGWRISYRLAKGVYDKYRKLQNMHKR